MTRGIVGHAKKERRSVDDGFLAPSEQEVTRDATDRLEALEKPLGRHNAGLVGEGGHLTRQLGDVVAMLRDDVCHLRR